MHDDEDALTFTEFALPPTITSAIGDLGFTHCTPIQGAVLPYSLSDYDITGQAQTGTGKTAAFLITILAQQIEFSPGEPRPTGAPRALVLAPTRELALQIEADARDLSRHTSTHVVAVVGGMDFDRQQKQLENRPVDILVATP